jgi:hypothetical protein
MSRDENGNTDCSNMKNCYDCKDSSNCMPLPVPVPALTPTTPTRSNLKANAHVERHQLTGFPFFFQIRQRVQPTYRLQQHEQQRRAFFLPTYRRERAPCVRAYIADSWRQDCTDCSNCTDCSVSSPPQVPPFVDQSVHDMGIPCRPEAKHDPTASLKPLAYIDAHC